LNLRGSAWGVTYKMDNAAEEVNITKYHIQIARHILSMTVLAGFVMSQGTLPREHPSSWKRKRKEHDE